MPLDYPGRAEDHPGRASSVDGRRVAYARVVTDHASFAWLCDAYVDRDHRGRGLGRRLVETVVERLDELGIGRALVSTRDAHGVYRGSGFERLPDPTTWLIRTPGRG